LPEVEERAQEKGKEGELGKILPCHSPALLWSDSWCLVQRLINQDLNSKSDTGLLVDPGQEVNVHHFV